MNKIVLFFFLLLVVSCNIVGETIGEVGINNEITSLENISLKKGDEIVFWSKIAVKYDTLPEIYKYKYLISCNDIAVKYDSSYLFNGNHNLHSEKEIVKDTIKNFDDKDSIITRNVWNFEIENFTYKVLKDGKYSFDFKTNRQLNNSFFFDSNSISASILIRKK